MRQAERRRADLLKQAQSLTEVRVDVERTRGLTEILEEICEGNFYRQQLNLQEDEPCMQAFTPALMMDVQNVSYGDHETFFVVCCQAASLTAHDKVMYNERTRNTNFCKHIQLCYLLNTNGMFYGVRLRQLPL